LFDRVKLSRLTPALLVSPMLKIEKLRATGPLPASSVPKSRSMLLTLMAPSNDGFAKLR